MLAQPRVDEREVGGGGEHERQTDYGGSRDVDAGNDAREVEEQHEEEDRREQRQEALAVDLAEQVFRDVDAHEVERHLDRALEAAGHDAHTARTEPEHEDEKPRDDEAQQHDAVDLEELVALEEDSRREEVTDRGTAELRPVRTVNGRHWQERDQGGSAQGSLQNRGITGS